MFSEILANFHEEEKNKKSYYKKKPKKIELPSTEFLPVGVDRNRLYQRLYKQLSDVREANIINCRKNNKPYYEKNKEKLQEKHICECGIYYSLYNKAHHQKSKRHNKLLSEMAEEKMTSESLEKSVNLLL